MGKNIKVPDNIALATFDDPSWAKFMKPGLTAVRQPAYQLGVEASNRLLTMIEEGVGKSTIPHRILLRPELIIRDSTMKRGENQ